MINLQMLEEAFAPIAEIGKGELSVKMGDLHVTLRVLTPEELINSQQYASAEGEETSIALYVERLKLSMLSYAIVQVGNNDLRNVSYIPTDSGKVERHVAIRKLIEKWASHSRDFLFQRYGDLQLRVGMEAEKLIQFTPPDLEAEIRRLEDRLTDLKAERDKGTAPTPTDIVQAAIQEAPRKEQLQTELYQSTRSQVAKPVDLLSDVPDSFSDLNDDSIAAENARLAAMRKSRPEAIAPPKAGHQLPRFNKPQ